MVRNSNSNSRGKAAWAGGQRSISGELKTRVREGGLRMVETATVMRAQVSFKFTNFNELKSFSRWVNHLGGFVREAMKSTICVVRLLVVVKLT